MSGDRVFALAILSSVWLAAGVACGAGDGPRAAPAESEHVVREDSGAVPPTELRRILSRSVSSLPDSRIRTARIGRPPPGLAPSRKGWWLFFELTTQRRPDYALGAWQARVVAGVLREEARRRGLPSIGGLSLTRVLANGRKVPATSGPILLELPPTRRTSADGLATTIRANARRAGWSDTEVDAFNLLDYLAVMVRIRTANVDPFFDDLSGTLVSIVGPANGWGQRARAEGAYVEVRDLAGRLVLASAYSVRTGDGIATVGTAYADRARGG